MKIPVFFSCSCGWSGFDPQSERTDRSYIFRCQECQKVLKELPLAKGEKIKEQKHSTFGEISMVLFLMICVLAAYGGACACT